MDKKEEQQKPVVVKQFIANWYEKNKNHLEFNMWDYVYRFDMQENTSFKEWFNDSKTEPFKTLVNMHQFGYKVEKEKKYIIKLKNVQKGSESFKFDRVIEKWCFGFNQETSSTRLYHTKKDLVDAGFEWMFSCPGFEIKEVEE